MASPQSQAPPLDAANLDPHAGTKYDFPRNLIGYGRHPPNAQWPGGAKIAVSFVINYEEVSRRPPQALLNAAFVGLETHFFFIGRRTKRAQWR